MVLVWMNIWLKVYTYSLCLADDTMDINASVTSHHLSLHIVQL